MNCRDFDQTWNQLLDAETGPGRAGGGGAADGREASLRGHAESCEPCRARHAQYEALRAALRSWAARPLPAPADPPALADRVLAAVAGAPTPARPRPASRARPFAFGLAGAAAAAAIAAVVVATRPEPARPGRGPDAPPTPPGSLRVAVADARDASWRLALSASEPAARLGLAMLDASIAPAEPAPGPTPADAGTAPPLDPSAFRPALLDRFGDYAAAGVRPLSDSAARAFGFLRPPSAARADAPEAPPADPQGA